MPSVDGALDRRSMNQPNSRGVNDCSHRTKKAWLLCQASRRGRSGGALSPCDRADRLRRGGWLRFRMGGPASFSGGGGRSSRALCVSWPRLRRKRQESGSEPASSLFRSKIQSGSRRTRRCSTCFRAGDLNWELAPAARRPRSPPSASTTQTAGQCSTGISRRFATRWRENPSAATTPSTLDCPGDGGL